MTVSHAQKSWIANIRLDLLFESLVFAVAVIGARHIVELGSTSRLRLYGKGYEVEVGADDWL